MSEIKLSVRQERAVEAVQAWLHADDKPFFYLEGLPGTGKSTIAKYLIESHNGNVHPMAYTGAAANIMRERGFPTAQTIHSKIYLPAQERKAEAEALERELLEMDELHDEKRVVKIKKRLKELYEPEFVLKPSPFESNDLIVLDECSFVGKREGEDLLSYGIPILVLGDSGQLPPPKGTGFFVSKKPDYILTEIHRQALGSPIIQLSNDARAGRPLKFGTYGNCEVIRARDVTDAMLLSVEQILVGQNKTKHRLNQRVRDLKGFTGAFPNANERLMCLRNNRERGIFNGEIFYTVADTNAEDAYARVDFERLGCINVHKECFTDPGELDSWSFQKRKFADEFAYGYACTIHKSQGNQYKSVLLIPDIFTWPSAYEDRKKLLTTGISRAIDRVIIAL